MFYYHNDGETPLNGVEIQLWNGGIPVQTTMSFNDVEGGNGAGYLYSRESTVQPALV